MTRTSYFRNGAFAALLIVLLFSASAAAAAAPDPILSWTVEDTLNVTVIESAALSPDGAWVAYTARYPVMTENRNEYVSTIRLAKVDGTTDRQLFDDGCSRMSPGWSPDGTSLAYISFETGAPNVFVARPDGTGATQVTDAGTGVLRFGWSPDGGEMAYLAFAPPSPEECRAIAGGDDPIVIGSSNMVVRLWVTDVPNDHGTVSGARLLTPENCSVRSWDWAPDGRFIAFTHSLSPDERYGYNYSVSRVDTMTGEIAPLLPGSRVAYEELGYSPDGKWIAVRAIHPLYFVDILKLPADGGEPVPVASSLDGAALLTGLRWSADSEHLYLPTSRGTGVAITELSTDGAAPRYLFSYGCIGSFGMNANRSHFAYIAEDSLVPQEVYVTPVDAFSPVQVTHCNAALPLERLGSTEVIRWNSTGGLEIEGILTLPANYTPGERYPLIVEIHGGPYCQFYRHFIGGMTWPICPAGTFSSQGYAVLRPNIRGSTGYGAEFTRANYRDWGGGDYGDAMAGVDHLVTEGVADPERLAILGQSYGGYMTAWAVTQTDRFDAAVMIDGISDLVSLDGTHDIIFDLHDNFGAYCWEDPAIYISRSPVYHVGNVTTPTLILHGENDLRVPVGQAWEFYDALWKRGVPVEMVIYPRAGHFPGEPRQQLDLFNREIAWCEEYVR
ncbi:MAG: S9 family peptidase [Methanoculleus sp.]|nr:S9 family peptidase [Methanoculleus sp.]